ncbi:MAG: hypothetical protein ACO1OB_31045 [Archangium sp.]
MGLAERRWVQERKGSDEKTISEKVNTITGNTIPLEIDWDGFSAAMDDTQYISNDSYGLPQLTTALEKIAVDDLGKEALKAGIKKIVIKPAKADGASFNFADGTITWNAYFGSSSGGYIYADAMVKTLEKGL